MNCICLNTNRALASFGITYCYHYRSSTIFKSKHKPDATAPSIRHIIFLTQQQRAPTITYSPRTFYTREVCHRHVFAINSRCLDKDYLPSSPLPSSRRHCLRSSDLRYAYHLVLHNTYITLISVNTGPYTNDQ